MAAHSRSTTYANFISERQGRDRDAYGGNYEQLVAVKKKYDPSNFFRLNQNLDPARSAGAELNTAGRPPGRYTRSTGAWLIARPTVSSPPGPPPGRHRPASGSAPTRQAAC